MKITKLLFFITISLITGFILGRAFYDGATKIDVYQNYLDPQIPINQFNEMVSADVIRNGNDIWVVDHKSGHLIFEFNKFKEVDKDSFREYSDLLLETSGNEAEGKPSLSYRAK